MNNRGMNNHKGMMLYVEILQNGASVASAVRPLGRTGHLWISGNNSGPLAIPLYGDRANTDLFHSARGKTLLSLDRFWEGFLLSAGEVFEVTRKHRPAGPLEVRRGDYGSLSNGDLMLLYRVGPKQKIIEPAILRSYRPGLFTGMIRDGFEIPSAAYATLLAGLLVGGFGIGLLQHPGLPKLSFETIADEYNLPFIAPGHFETAPEALQNNLVRSSLTRNVVQFYRSVIDSLSGRGKPNDAMTYPQSRKLASNAYQALDRELNELREAQGSVTAATLKKPASAIIAIPAMEGISTSGEVQRIQDKIELFQKGLQRNLDMKQKVRGLFPKDAIYDFNLYRDIKPGQKSMFNEAALAALAKIRPFGEFTDEEAMYYEAMTSGQKARAYAKWLQGPPTKDTTKKKLRAVSLPVGLSAKVAYVTYVFSPEKIFNDSKADALQGSSIDPAVIKTQKIIEPLIGEIDPALVESTIQKYRFELQQCFEGALKRDRFTRGAMEWRWRIDSRGQMDDLELVKSNINDPNMTRCVRQKMNAWRFPKPRRGSVEITYPFEFNPTRG